MHNGKRCGRLCVSPTAGTSLGEGEPQLPGMGARPSALQRGAESAAAVLHAVLCLPDAAGYSCTRSASNLAQAPTGLEPTPPAVAKSGEVAG